jgi:hypothetical protein
MVLKITASLYIITVFIFSHLVSYTFIPKLAAILLGLVYILHALKNHERIVHITSVHIVFLLWLALSVVSGLLTASPAANLQRGWTVVQVFIVSIVLYSTILNTDSFTWFAWAFVSATLVSSLGVDVGLLPKIGFAVNPYLGGRFSATLGNANVFGYVCVVSISFIVYLWKTHSKFWLRILLGLIFIYLSAKIIDTGSRKAIFGLAGITMVGYVASVYSTKGARTRKQIATIIVGAIMMIAIVGVFFTYVMQSEHAYRIRNVDRFLKGEQLEKGEQSLAQRKILVETGLDLFYQKPAFGQGLASFAESKIGKHRWGTIGVYSHSNIIEVLVSSGIIGFTLYYSMFLIILTKLLLYARGSTAVRNDPILIFVATILPFSIFFDFFAITYYVKEAWLVLTSLIAGTALLRRKLQSNIRIHSYTPDQSSHLQSSASSI